jgi:acyl-coenzyme A thioesterase PaaI-like protein
MNAIATEARMPVHLDQSLRASSRGTAARRAELDILLEEITPGRCAFATNPAAHSGPGESPFHGSVYATLIQFALEAAVQSTLTPATDYLVVRQTFRTSPADTPPRGRLEARAEATVCGGSRIEARGVVVDEAGRIRAEATMLALTEA